MTATCLECDSVVSQQFTKVFGDRDNAIHACPNCATYRELKRGGAAGLEPHGVI